MSKKKIVVLTGAGMSAESGLSTFRATGGLWEQHRIEDVATPEGWHKNPGWQVVLLFVSEKSEKGLPGTKNTGVSFSRLAAAGYKAACSQ